jgi:Cys-tRNA(Pro)/Cys-tRNA(Cys) deacylase
LKKTGYPVGGIPAFGYEATFLMDPKVLEKKEVYSGGGLEQVLTIMSTQSMHKANGASIVRVRS